MPDVTQAPEDQYAASSVPKVHINFCDYAVDNFDPDLVVRKLFKNHKKDKWQFPLLFQGLRAWTLDNEDAKFLRNSVVRHIGELLAQRHTELMEQWSARPGVAFLALGAHRPLIPILKGAFGQIGGMAAIMSACSKKELDQTRQTQFEHAKSVVDLMSVVHLYASTSGKDPHPAKMSIEFNCILVKELQDRRKQSGLIAKALSADSLRDHWSAAARSSALIYAAALLKYKGIVLLDILFSPSPSYFRSRVFRWLKLAKRISRDVRKHCKFHKGKAPLLVRFPNNMKATKLPPPNLRLCEAIWLVGKFQELEPTWKVVGEEVQRRSLKPCALSASSATRCVACSKFKGRFDSDLLPVIARY